MSTACSPGQLEFPGVGRRRVRAAFDGGPLSSDGGALLLRQTDLRLRLVERFAACFTDHRDAGLTEHRVVELLRQRVYGIALGYEDLNDHNDLRGDPLLAVAVGKADPDGHTRLRAADRGKALASASTLNRLELTPADATPASRYKKVVYHAGRIEAMLVEMFLDSFRHAPPEIILDFDVTDDQLHGHQEGRFWHGYYGGYCYLPLYVTCGDHLLVAQWRTANQDVSAGVDEVLARLVAQIRARWPKVRIIVRGDSGFARDRLMAWCEAHGVCDVLGLAKNICLLQKIGKELAQAQAAYQQTGAAVRVFTHFWYRTRKSWSAVRRVIAKAEYLSKGANPRFIVTNLPERYAAVPHLYEGIYCARGEMENRIKEQQLDLFADRTSSHTLRANQLRLWFASIAYILVSALRRLGLRGTRLARATCGSIRVKLLKIGAQLRVTVRCVWIHLASACPYQDVFTHAWRTLLASPLRT